MKLFFASLIVMGLSFIAELRRKPAGINRRLVFRSTNL